MQLRGIGMTPAIRVLIADDHLIVREGLRMILADYPEVTLVGEAENGLQAIELAGETHPDVILMDLRMPDLDGLSAITKIKAQWPEIAIVILTTYNEDELMIRGLQAGAQGFVLKDTGRQALFDTIQAAFRGDTLLQSDTLNRLLPKIETSPMLPTQSSKQDEIRSRTVLSQRELEILKLVATGARNKEIAAQLNISQSTVKAHLDSVFNKLGVDSRTAAVSIASQYGLLND
jgi:NarL family two-component system response regulator YdfI